MKTTTKRLTRRQAQILDYLRQSLRERGFAPSIREIGEAVGLSSSSTVHTHLRTLEARGHILRHPSKPRSIMLADRDGSTLQERVADLEGLVREATPWAERAARPDREGSGAAQVWLEKVRAAGV